MPLWEKTNAFLQKEEPLIHILKDVMIRQIEKTLTYLVKTELLVDANIREVEYRDEENQKTDEDIFVGQRTRSYLDEHSSDLQTE